MTKAQRAFFNVVALLLVVLILADLWLTIKNRSLSRQVNQMQVTIINARRIEPILTQLSLQIAKRSDQDPALRELMKRHNLQVTLDVEGGKKRYP